MKKIIAIIFLVFLTFSCGQETNVEKKEKKTENIKEKCLEPYKVGTKLTTKMTLKGVVINDDNTIITSPQSGKLTYLNCKVGTKVSPKTLIAKITPDPYDPNVKNLRENIVSLKTQKINLQAQIANIKNNKISTANSFDIQISNVDSSIESLKGQIEILKQNIENAKKTGEVNISDIDLQIASLKKQIAILKENIENAKKSKKTNLDDVVSQSKTLIDSIKKLVKQRDILKKSEAQELEKLNVSKENMLVSIENTIESNLKKIDETFSITNKNKDTNKKFRDYLSAKNVSYKNEVKEKYFDLAARLKNFSSLSDEEKSKLMQDVIDYDVLVNKAINASIDNVYFTKTTIDNLYNAFLTYSNNLATLKTNFDNFPETAKSLKINYENQLNSLENQIEQLKNNLASLEENKKDLAKIGGDTQILNLESQLKTLQANLKNLEENKRNSVKIGTETQILNLESQLKNFESNLQTLYGNKNNLIQNKKTSLSSLDNQIIQLENSIAGIESNINSINISLSPSLVYAGVDGVIKQKMASKLNKLGPNTPICNILPTKNSLRIKVYSPVELEKNMKLTFEFNKKKYSTTIKNVLVYKDQITKNFVYETDYLNSGDFKEGEILNLKLDKEFTSNNNKQIKSVPVSYIINKIEGKYLKVETSSGITEKKVNVGEINGDFIEVKDKLDGIKNICK